jgi:enediyne biosynthesis protein E2
MNDKSLGEGIMSTFLGALRRLLLTPKLGDVTFAKRGFPTVGSTAVEHLEAIPQSVICGFEWGIDSRGLWEVERRLSVVEPEHRGFAYEGAAMAGGRGRRTRELLVGPGQPHIFLTYIGIGFAMARLPRVLWKKVIPDLTGSAYYPTMSWLAVDGYGFDRAYFDTRRWVDKQYVPTPYPWEGAPDYFLRVVDQGIGRALWFIHGAQAANVAAAVRGFADHCQADLWSGVGLAATFAGGCALPGLTELRAASGAHHAELALGAVFAVKTRTYAGFVPAHTRLAATVLADLSIDAAVAIADAAAVDPDQTRSGHVPAYKLWRQRIRDHFVSSAKAA